MSAGLDAEGDSRRKRGSERGRRVCQDQVTPLSLAAFFGRFFEDASDPLPFSWFHVTEKVVVCDGDASTLCLVAQKMPSSAVKPNGFLPTSIPLPGSGKKPFLPFSTLQVCLSIFLRRRLPYFG